MNKTIKATVLSLIIVSFLILPTLVFAQDPAPSSKMINFVTTVANKGGYQTDPNIASTPRIIGIIVGAFIAFLGLTFIIMMILAGYNWMMADGNEEQVKKAKATIKQALIGLVVAISGYTLWNFVFNSLISK